MPRFNARSAVLICILTATALPAMAQWSTLSIDHLWDNNQWYRDNNCNQTSYTLENTGLVSLNPSNFTNQQFSNTHVQYTDNGTWLIMGYGDSNLGDSTVCDQIYVVRRNPNSSYCIPPSSALAYPPVSPQCVNYLGSGAGIAKTLTATSASYCAGVPGGCRYFAIVPAGDNTNSLNHAWLTWAVSADGITWQFVSNAGGLTSDPRLSVQLIRRSDLEACNPNGCHFWHNAMIYNKYDNYFYIVQGYGATNGLRATWWRISFNSANAYGLTGSVGNYQVERRSGSGYVVTWGIIPTDDSWTVAAMDPTPNGNPSDPMSPVDPMDIVQLYKTDGSFDSMLFIYQPLANVFSTPTPIAYAKGTATGGVNGNFAWASPIKTLTGTDMAKVFDDVRYSACPGNPGGNYLSVNQSGWQPNGYPQLYGYISASPHPCPYPTPVQGILMLQFNLN